MSWRLCRDVSHCLLVGTHENRHVTRDTLPRIAAGDQAAIDECLTRYGGLVLSIARRLLRDQGDVEDAVQDVFVAIWESAERFDPTIASEKTYVGVIARRRVIDQRRRNNRTPQPASLGDFDPPSNCDNQAELNDEMSRVREQWNELREEERQVLDLAIYKGMTYPEIAEMCDLPLGTVKTRARTGLSRLRDRLQKIPATRVREDLS